MARGSWRVSSSTSRCAWGGWLGEPGRGSDSRRRKEPFGCPAGKQTAVAGASRLRCGRSRILGTPTPPTRECDCVQVLRRRRRRLGRSWHDGEGGAARSTRSHGCGQVFGCGTTRAETSFKHHQKQGFTFVGPLEESAKKHIARASMCGPSDGIRWANLWLLG